MIEDRILSDFNTLKFIEPFFLQGLAHDVSWLIFMYFAHFSSYRQEWKDHPVASGIVTFFHFSLLL